MVAGRIALHTGALVDYARDPAWYVELDHHRLIDVARRWGCVH
jgi:hypothetical protein